VFVFVVVCLLPCVCVCCLCLCLLSCTCSLAALAPHHRGFGYNHKMADDVFDVFTNHIATPDRPLYFHTDETSLRGLFIYLQDKLGKKPTILPWRVRSCHEPWLAPPSLHSPADD